jgi:hypothetical protein
MEVKEIELFMLKEIHIPGRGNQAAFGGMVVIMRFGLTQSSCNLPNREKEDR